MSLLELAVGTLTVLASLVAFALLIERAVAWVQDRLFVRRRRVCRRVDYQQKNIAWTVGGRDVE